MVLTSLKKFRHLLLLLLLLIKKSAHTAHIKYIYWRNVWNVQTYPGFAEAYNANVLFWHMGCFCTYLYIYRRVFEITFSSVCLPVQPLLPCLLLSLEEPQGGCWSFVESQNLLAYARHWSPFEPLFILPCLTFHFFPLPNPFNPSFMLIHHRQL